MVAASRNSILRLINASQHSACPCHGCRPSVHPTSQLQTLNHLRNFATPVNTVEKEYAFEVHLSRQAIQNIRMTYFSVIFELFRLLHPTWGSGMALLQRLEWILKIWKHARWLTLHGDILLIDKYFQVGVFTDPNVAKLRAMKTVSIWVTHNYSILILNENRLLLPWKRKLIFHLKYLIKWWLNQRRTAGVRQ